MHAPAWWHRYAAAVFALLVLCAILRLPRLEGPLDFRFDAGVYYTLGTSLAQGKGYRILSEPGEIGEVTYPPLLPAIAAEYFIAELPFALVATLLFGVVGSGKPSALHPVRTDLREAISAGLLALAGFFLRTAGVTLFAVWAGESAVRRQWRQCLIRVAAAVAAVLLWQLYVSDVKRQPEYTAPRYDYQRAAYQWYNVPYSESMLTVARLGTLSY